MSHFEYLVVPAPRIAPRRKGVRSASERFAHEITDVVNAHAAQGWEYHRAETLPCEARRGFLGRKTVSSETLLVFRRRVDEDAASTSRPWGEPEETPEALAAELSVPRASLGPSRSEPRLHPVPGADRR